MHTQRLPDTLLEGRALHVERQIETARRGLDEAHHFGDQGLIPGVAADEIGLGKAVLQLARKRVWIIAQENRANAFLAGGDEDRAKRGLAYGECDCPRPAPPARKAEGVMPKTAFDFS